MVDSSIDIVYLADWPELQPVIASWLHGEWGAIRRESLTECEALLRRNAQKGPCPVVLVARKAGVPVGTASLLENDLPTHSHLWPWLADVYVPPAHRGCGIARALVWAVQAHALRSGFRKLYLFTTGDGALYRDLGWARGEAIVYRGEPATIWSWEADKVALPQGDGSTEFEYARYVLEYQYKLKAEETARAQALVTAGALITSGGAVAGTVLSRNLPRFEDQSLAGMVTLGAAALGIVLFLSSQILVLLVYHPTVTDSNSPLEPGRILRHGGDTDCLVGINAHKAAVDLMREARAVSQVHMLRTRRIVWSVRCALAALVSFAVALAALVFKGWQGRML